MPLFIDDRDTWKYTTDGRTVGTVSVPPHNWHLEGAHQAEPDPRCWYCQPESQSETEGDLSRADDLTARERLIELRKDGPEKMMRKRAPKGTVLTDKRQLREGEKYRTPMSDDGHLWEVGTRFFRCGMWIEYPKYYDEGWHVLLGPYWVQVDERKGKLCVQCKPSGGDPNWDEAIAKTAAKFGVETKRPSEGPPRKYTIWIGAERLRRSGL